MRTYKRYIVFGFDNYYPNGGFDDVLGDEDTIGEIDEKIDYINGYFTYKGYCRKHYQIFDCEERIMVQATNTKGFLD